MANFTQNPRCHPWSRGNQIAVEIDHGDGGAALSALTTAFAASTMTRASSNGRAVGTRINGRRARSSGAGSFFLASNVNQDPQSRRTVERRVSSKCFTTLFLLDHFTAWAAARAACHVGAVALNAYDGRDVEIELVQGRNKFFDCCRRSDLSIARLMWSASMTIFSAGKWTTTKSSA